MLIEINRAGQGDDTVLDARSHIRELPVGGKPLTNCGLNLIVVAGRAARLRSERGAQQPDRQ